MSASNWVSPGVQPQPKADIIRRQDVIDQLGRVVDVYEEQQQAMLGTITHGAQHGVFSTADQVRERRWTSAMYLLYYGLVAGAVMFGLTTIAYRFEVVDSYSAFAIWMVGTGSFALWLAWIRHGQELEQTPEAVARHIVDWHGSVAEYDARTRRKALRWEFEAEERRQLAAESDNAHARQMAQLRIAEMESRRRAYDVPVAPVAEIAASAPPAVPPAPPADNSTDDSAPTWQAVLLAFFAALYDRDSAGWLNMTDRGVISVQVPWSARAKISPADKQRMLDVVRSRPPVVEQIDGGRWRLRLELFSTAEGTVDLLSERCRRLSG